MNVSNNYDVRELVHPELIEFYGVAKVAKYLPIYATGLVLTQQAIRDWCGCPVTVNDYMWDPDYKSGGWEAIKDRQDLYVNSGVRNFSERFGKGFSAHYAFACTDSKPKDYDTGQLQQDILRNPKTFPHVVRMEDARDTRSSRGKLGRDWMHSQSGVLLPGSNVDVFRP